MAGPAATRLALIAVIALAVLLPGTSAAQDRSELDALLSGLATAPDAGTAQVMEQRIWELWFEAPPPASKLLDEARAAASRGAIPEALALFERLTDEFPHYAEGWNQRAIMHYLAGDFAASLGAIERALALEPRHFGALAGRGQCEFRLARPREALEAFDAALAINPWMDAVREQAELLRSVLGPELTPI
jgi:tetratricopeptide (TPR) repeat protein